MPADSSRQVRLAGQQGRKPTDDESRGNPAVIYIVGGPIYLTLGSQFSVAELRGRAAALKIAERVGFIGFQSRPADVYRALDIVVHASTRPNRSA